MCPCWFTILMLSYAKGTPVRLHQVEQVQFYWWWNFDFRWNICSSALSMHLLVLHKPRVDSCTSRAATPVFIYTQHNKGVVLLFWRVCGLQRGTRHDTNVDRLITVLQWCIKKTADSCTNSNGDRLHEVMFMYRCVWGSAARIKRETVFSRVTSARTWAARPPAPPVFRSSSFSGTQAAGRRVSGACSGPDRSTALTAARRRRQRTGWSTGPHPGPGPARRALRPGRHGLQLQEFHQTFSHVLGLLQHARSSPCCWETRKTNNRRLPVWEVRSIYQTRHICMRRHLLVRGRYYSQFSFSFLFFFLPKNLFFYTYYIFIFYFASKISIII